MGRLFWKFFVFLWLAQLLAALGVGFAVWSLRPESGVRPPPPKPEMHQPPPFADRPPPPPHGLPPHRDFLMRPLLPFLPPLAPLLAGSLVSLLVAALLAWYFSRPIRTLRNAFNAVAEGRLETRVAPAMGARRDELADLGREFDRMAKRLQSLIEGQQRLLHDVSHEMRSPLARLQAAVGLLRQQPERSLEIVERIERDTERMDRLVGELLLLARLDAGTVPQLDEAVDLSALLAEIADDATFEAAVRGCRVAVEIADSMVIQGSAELLHRALENIVRNAVRHSPPNGTIWLKTEAESGREAVRISVRDEGAGVPAALLGQLFRPFFRAESAGSFSGFGLGLAITRRVAELHRGAVEARNHEQGGLEVVLTLPLPADVC